MYDKTKSIAQMTTSTKIELSGIKVEYLLYALIIFTLVLINYSYSVKSWSSCPTSNMPILAPQSSQPCA
jgi:hypothetical protein